MDTILLTILIIFVRQRPLAILYLNIKSKPNSQITKKSEEIANLNAEIVRH